MGAVWRQHCPPRQTAVLGHRLLHPSPALPARSAIAPPATCPANLPPPPPCLQSSGQRWMRHSARILWLVPSWVCGALSGLTLGGSHSRRRQWHCMHAIDWTKLRTFAAAPNLLDSYVCLLPFVAFEAEVMEGTSLSWAQLSRARAGRQTREEESIGHLIWRLQEWAPTAGVGRRVDRATIR